MADKVALGMLMLAVAGVIFHAGQISARVAELERWRSEMRDDMQYIRGKLDELTRAIREGRS